MRLHSESRRPEEAGGLVERLGSELSKEIIAAAGTVWPSIPTLNGYFVAQRKKRGVDVRAFSKHDDRLPADRLVVHAQGRGQGEHLVNAAVTAQPVPTRSRPHHAGSDPRPRSGGGPQAPKAVSIRDVAKAAGVSHQTVSRVVNGHPRVKESTRARVLDVIAEMGYTPNRMARALAGGAVRSVTVLTSDTSLYGASATLKGIEEAARAADFAVGISVLDTGSAQQPADVAARVSRPGRRCW